MEVEDARARIEAAGFGVADVSRIANDTGWKISLDNGAFVNVFDKGTFNIQGKNKEQLEGLFADPAIGNVRPKAARQLAPLARQVDAPKEVFVVYGHDTHARTQLEAILRRWGLTPLILDQLPSEGTTIIEKLEQHTAKGHFAVVLATPDDEGHRRDHSDEKTFRARQNVVLELGMMLAMLGRKRVAVLLKQQETMERPSDIQGLIYIPFKDDVAEIRLQLAQEMTAQGFAIDLKNV